MAKKNTNYGGPYLNDVAAQMEAEFQKAREGKPDPAFIPENVVDPETTDEELDGLDEKSDEKSDDDLFEDVK